MAKSHEDSFISLILRHDECQACAAVSSYWSQVSLYYLKHVVPVMLDYKSLDNGSIV